MIRFPAHADPRLRPALGALGAGDWEQARRIYERVAADSPDLAEAQYGLGYALMRLGRTAPAIEHAERAVALDPDHAEYRYALATMLRSRGDLAGAIDAYRATLAIDPDETDCRIDLAGALEQAGRLDEAEAELRAQLEATPGEQRADAHLVRVRLRSGGGSAEDLASWRATLDAILAKPDDPLVEAEAADVLIDVCERLEDFPAAFAAMRRMNDAETRRHPPAMPDEHREPFLRAVAEQAAGLYTSVAQRWKNLAPDDGLPAPALLVGFPRSGTTLTERALDAHRGIVSIEERPTFETTKASCLAALGPAARGRPLVEVLDGLPAERIAELRAFYWDRVAEALGGPPPEGAVVLDKLPLRIMELSFVNRLFPEARVLVALRDPRDVCLSCFRQRFEPNRAMSFFVDPALTARLYAAVMSAWASARGTCSFPWLEVRYEDTVADMEGRLREMVGFLGLGWDDAVVRFRDRDAERASTTPSYHAVRRPVGAGAVGRWRRYAGELAPILPTLEPLVEAFGYESTRAALGA